MSEELTRLSKLMAQRGICSRREADAFIEQGLVVVDGVIISQLGTKVSPDAEIKLSPKASKQQNNLVTIILHKPIGYVSAQPEDNYQPAIKLITRANQFGESRLRLQPAHLKVWLSPDGWTLIRKGCCFLPRMGASPKKSRRQRQSRKRVHRPRRRLVA